MSDIKKLIEIILSDEKLRSRKSFQDAIYRDEPIIQPASHMKSYVPDKIREMKEIASSLDMRYRSKERIFYSQAKFMESYEDDYDRAAEFFDYFPTYQQMRSDQLRTYFSWRTKVRSGEIKETSLSYVFVYLYELLHLIGADSPEDALSKMQSFSEEYGKIAPKVKKYVEMWSTDLAIYYGVDMSTVDGVINTALCRAVDVLGSYETCGDGELFEAICAVSTYNIKGSKLYKAMGGDVCSVVCSVYRKMAARYDKNNLGTLLNKLFGKKAAYYYGLFSNAIFYDRKKHTDYTYNVSDSYKYFCKNGRWMCERYLKIRKNKWLGDVLRSIDSTMRQRLCFGNPINCPCDTKWVLAIIDKVTDELAENKKKAQAARIEIDISKLAGIRRSADITRDMLMTDEEMNEQTAAHAEPEAPEAVADEPVTDTPKNDTPLTDEEYKYLHSLLYGGGYSGKAMPSLLADSINEKLFYLFQDVVIEEVCDKLAVVGEYTEELKGLIK